jgi:hypothetical protein
LDKRPKLKKLDIRFGTRSVRSLYRAGLFMTAAKEVTRYKLDLVGVQEIIEEGDDTEPAGEYILFYGKGNENHELGEDFCTKENHISRLEGRLF